MQLLSGVLLVLAEQILEFEFGEREEIHDLENTDSIDDEEREEPPRLAAPGRMPERKPFPKYAPERNDSDERREPKRKPDPEISTPIMRVHSSKY